MQVLRLLAAMSVGWVVLLLAASSLSPPIAAASYAVGSFLCHQIPERSFHMGGYQLPVCARCFGIYVGGALAALAIAAQSRPPGAVTSARRSHLTPSRARALAAVGALPTAVTVAAEWIGVWAPTNMTRALAGAPLGMAVVGVVIGAWATVHYDGCPSRPPRVSSPPRPPI